MRQDKEERESTRHTIWIAFCAMLLHCDMCVEMVESAICFVAFRERTLIETLDLVVATAGAFLDGIAG